jgi:plasmid stability protein
MAKPKRPLPSGMKRYTVDLPDELHKRIKIYCARHEIRMADWVRKILDEHLPKNP